MSRVRIEFLKAGAVVKKFDRNARDKAEAVKLAAEIAQDSGIEHDTEKVAFERKFKALLLQDGKRVEILESKAFDDDDAKAVASKWVKSAGVQFTEIKVQFLEA